MPEEITTPLTEERVNQLINAQVARYLKKIMWSDVAPTDGQVPTWDADTTRWTYTTAAGGSGGTLDDAYDFGGAGAGRTITSDTGAVVLTNTDADTNANLESARASTTDPSIDVEVSGDAHPRMRIRSDGRISWDDGTTASFDVWLERAAATVLEIEGAGGSLSATLRVDQVEGSTSAPNRFHASQGIFIDAMMQLAGESETISAGSITIDNAFVTVLGQGGASDDLDTIGVTGGSVFSGDFVVLMAENDTQTITVKHNTGNIKCIGGADIALDDLGDFVILMRQGSTWYAMGIAAGSHTHTNDHARSHDLESASDHTTSSGVDGDFLRQTGASSFAFESDYYAISAYWDGDGSAVTGMQSVAVPSGGVVESWQIWTLDGTDRTATVDVDNGTNADPPVWTSIAGSEKPTLGASVQWAEDTSLSTWTTTVAASDLIRFEIEAATATTLAVTLRVRKT